MSSKIARLEFFKPAVTTWKLGLLIYYSNFHVNFLSYLIKCFIQKFLNYVKKSFTITIIIKYK